MTERREVPDVDDICAVFLLCSRRHFHVIRLLHLTLRSLLTVVRQNGGSYLRVVSVASRSCPMNIIDVLLNTMTHCIHAMFYTAKTVAVSEVLFTE